MGIEDSDSQPGIVTAIVGTLVALVVGITVGVGISSSNRPKTAPAVLPGQAVPGSSAQVALPAAVDTPGEQLASPHASDAASVQVDSGVVRFYFASGSAQLAPGSAEALKSLITAAQLGGKLAISGFHDRTGDQAQNRELALQRALAVSDILKAEGVPGFRIVLNNPVEMQGSGSMADARRVEVTLQ
ncbi:MAG: OmpA/MotB [Polaromonas sp.]|jgi:outer membrane protein OmpA-like peptidoglycan-associated protein|nr:OmpA/MotB [Polaromonas sp.]